ncbi:hypothetical protein ILYODFUR_020512 [Ilyodon furcidens]|uniref:Uncharacterized protein n=1 Tax=Ilyodon furcidens TaxID=33524 RepID=A0ABV0T9Q6_9TELE
MVFSSLDQSSLGGIRRFSIGFRSVDLDGHGRRLILYLPPARLRAVCPITGNPKATQARSFASEPHSNSFTGI